MSDDRGCVGDRVRFGVAIVLVAVGAAAFAVVFRSTLARWCTGVFGETDVVGAIASVPWLLRLGIPTVAGAAAGAIATLRGPSRQGVSNVMEAVVLGNIRLSLRTTALRVVASWTAIAGGMSIGREGPLIEVSGALGAAVGRALHTPSTTHVC